MALMLAGITTVAVGRLIATSGRMIDTAEDRHRDAQSDRTLRWIHRTIDHSEPAAAVVAASGGQARVDVTIDGRRYRIRRRGTRLELVRGGVAPEVLIDGVESFALVAPPGEPPILTVVRDGRTVQRQLNSIRRSHLPASGRTEEPWW